jgi:molecular chaperone DnaK
MYADVQKAAAAQGNTEAARPANDASEVRAGKPMDDDNVVDAEIKEVKKG